MKNNIIKLNLALFILTGFQLINAQITIESTDLPIVNKPIEIAISDGYGFDLGEAQADAQTWDFSFLPFVETKQFLLASPGDFWGASSFPQATMAQTTPFADVLGVSLTDLVTLPLDLPPANVFYGENEDGSINYQGIFADFNIEGATAGDTTSIAIEPPFNYYPVGTYGDQINSNGSFFFKVKVDEDLADLVLGTGFDLEALGISLSILDAGITVDVVSQVAIDAHGTLTTPKGDYEVLRFNETMFIDIKINAFLGAIDLGEVYTTNAVVKQFRFWGKEHNHPVLTVVEFDEQGGTSTLSVEYINEELPIIEPPIPSNIDDELVESLNLFPNPASNFLNIDLPQNWQNTQLKIYNALGEIKVAQLVNSNKVIDLSNFVSGIYFAEFKNENQLVRKTIVVK